jgi:hypothetical protein
LISDKNREFWEELIAYDIDRIEGSRCLETVGRIQIQAWKGFMKHSVETSSSAMIHISSFVQIGTGIQS